MEGFISAIRDREEEEFWNGEPGILDALLTDHATGKNIIWATDDYLELGNGFGHLDHIQREQITGRNYSVVIPRSMKNQGDKRNRTQGMAEVFTPAWVCNLQNNLVDAEWFGREGVFNVECDGRPHEWKATEGTIRFDEKPSSDSTKSWQDYVLDLRLEITCGEAPYLMGRRDSVTGEELNDLNQRAGLLDRKMRIVSENTDTKEEWFHWAMEALKSTYGYEWQGDSLLLARKGMLLTFLDCCRGKFGKLSKDELSDRLSDAAMVISWNLWQMDGLKMVVPYSCENRHETDIFGNEIPLECDACRRKRHVGHIGTHCLIRNWRMPPGHQEIEFQSLVS